jgi:hypothetical protein
MIPSGFVFVLKTEVARKMPTDKCLLSHNKYVLYLRNNRKFNNGL